VSSGCVGCLCGEKLDGGGLKFKKREQCMLMCRDAGGKVN
jgi:hypothetical protein